MRSRIILVLAVSFIAALLLFGFALIRISEKHMASKMLPSIHDQVQQVLAQIDPHTQGAKEKATKKIEQIPGVQVVRFHQEKDTAARNLIEWEPSGAYVEIAFERETLTNGSELFRFVSIYALVTAFAFAFFVYWALTFWIVKPIEALTDAVQGIADGKLQTRVSVGGLNETAALGRVFNSMAETLESNERKMKQQLDQIETSRAELENKQEQLVRSEKLASIGKLSAGVAHEIGNPLAAIEGLVDLAASPKLDEEKRTEFLNRTRKETQRIQKIIRDLLDFSRPDDAKNSAIYPSDPIQDVISLLQPNYRRLQFYLEIDHESRVLGNADRLKQVFLNLLINAAHASNEQGQVKIQLSTEDNMVQIDVVDQGEGVPEDLLGSLFQPFVSSKENHRGTGLGLAIAESILNDMGGWIEAKNRAEGGAVFSVHLPVAR